MKLQPISLLTVGLLLVSSVAHADDREKSDEHFRAGAKLYHEGRYSDAILELKQGYELAPHPVFLVNIALAYAKLSNYDEAATYARRAAKEEGLEPDPHAQTAARGDAWSTRSSAAVIATELATQPPEPTVEVAEPPEPPPRRKQKPTLLGWFGVGGIGLGLFNLTGAAITGAALGPTRNEYEIAAASGDRERYESLRDKIDRTQRVGQILFFSGAGLLVAGGALLIIDLTSGGEVAVGPGSVDLRWTF